MRIWILICVAGLGLAESGCFLSHRENAQYTAVPGLVLETTNSPTITIVSNSTPAAPTSAPSAVPESRPVPTVASTNTPATVPTSPAPPNAADVENNRAGAAAPAPATGSGTNASHPIVTPAQGLTGKVASVNAAGKFVVLSFPLGQMPAFDQALHLYRKGVKVAEVKVTGPKLDENIVADLAQGSAEVGDDVRDH